jgi:choline dehydrogenase-like flavoprotein
MGPDLTQPFDYVIIEGGTAGLVVASRLSEDPGVCILVIEAGPDNSEDPLVLTPGLLGAQYGRPEYDWNFLSMPQVYITTYGNALCSANTCSQT